MAAEPSNRRKDRLAAALKENLRRRKAQARAKATRAKAVMPPKANGLGAVPQAGLEGQGLKTAPKRI